MQLLHVMEAVIALHIAATFQSSIRETQRCLHAVQCTGHDDINSNYGNRCIQQDNVPAVSYAQPQTGTLGCAQICDEVGVAGQ